MKRVLLVIVTAISVAACGNKRKVPDVSKVTVDLQMQRFEKDFFSIDTTNVSASLQQLHQKYPGFLQDFVFNILALPAQPDSTKTVENGVKSFVTSYSSLKDSADRIF